MLKLIGPGMLTAALLFLFSSIQDLLKYVFSLGAVYAGIQLFKRYETLHTRLALVLTAILFLFYLLCILCGVSV